MNLLIKKIKRVGTASATSRTTASGYSSTAASNGEAVARMLPGWPPVVLVSLECPVPHRFPLGGAG
jgi:hypothetical protein